jgi:hypothetical protein
VCRDLGAAPAIIGKDHQGLGWSQQVERTPASGRIERLKGHFGKRSSGMRNIRRISPRAQDQTSWSRQRYYCRKIIKHSGFGVEAREKMESSIANLSLEGEKRKPLQVARLGEKKLVAPPFSNFLFRRH